MQHKQPFQPLIFLWDHHYFSHSVKQLIDQAGISIIVDVSELSSAQLAKRIERFSAIDLKLSSRQFFSDSIQDILVTKQIKSVWIEYFPDLSSHIPDDFFSRASSYDQIDCHVISGDLQFIKTCLGKIDCLSSIAVKGYESSGYVGNETTLSLISYFETIWLSDIDTLPVHIWGGITTPEGAAACLASGVDGVIFENLHCLTSEYLGNQTPESKKLEKLDIDHSMPIAIGSNQHFRAHDRGNSRAVKDIKLQRDRLHTDDDSTGSMKELVSVISSTSVSLFAADFTTDELIPLGPESAAASSFIKQFGNETEDSISRFTEETLVIVQDSTQTLTNMLKGRATEIMGTKYPFIQGAMACISDVPKFSLAVAKAGGLPTIALGIKSIEEIENELSDLQKLLGKFPYAVNIITLPENPHLKEQLSWVEKTRPPFVIISAGDPFKALELQQKGIEVIYVTSDIGLAQLAWNNGIRLVVCEGNEAGGHIGRHTTLTLAQEALGKKRQLSAEGKEVFLFLAGGIFNETSCARAALLGADGVQMGTVYLASHEIVSSGALSQLYQQSIIHASFGTTRITGKSIGLGVRSLDSPKIRTIVSLEQELNRLATDESEKRRRIEEVSIGSLFVAAKGRHPLSTEELTQEQCNIEGQFMSGVVAGLLNEAFSVQELHQHLTQGKLAGVRNHSRISLVTHIKRKKGQQRLEKERIAITGMAAINSLGNSPEEIWQACLSMKSGISQVSNDKWDHNSIYRPGSIMPGSTYCNVGAFISFDISRKELGLAPHVYQTMCEATKMTLWLAQNAIDDSKITHSDIPNHRIGVIVSQNAGEFASTLGELTLNTSAEEIERDILSFFDVVPKENISLVQAIQDGKLTIDDTTLLGRLNCAAAGYICNRYGFTGPSHAVTSACASSLTALYSAIQMIRTGALDAAIIGGGEELIIKASFLEFSALGALAGIGQHYSTPAAFSRPFDAQRSGMVLGEGGGMIVIERESVAIGRGAPILAYINGIGGSNNHRGMIESIAETQEIAIQNSFDDAGYQADQVDMIECHATSTLQGDIEEVKALSNIYPPNSSTVLTSIKSQIGHTLGASGIISLIRGVCAMRAGIYPPTINYDQPDSQIGLEEHGFRVLNQPEEWKTVNEARRFQVNSFGFGGANYVVQLEEAGQPDTRKDGAVPLTEIMTNIVGSDEEQEADKLGISFYSCLIDGQEKRVACLDKTLTQAAICKELQPILKQDFTLDKVQTSKLRDKGLYIGEPSTAQPFALVFAGQGSSYPQMGKQLYEEFDCIQHWLDTFNELCEFDLKNFLFSETNDELYSTKWVQPAVFSLEYAIYQQLRQFNIEPTALAGHSMGEICALCVADCFNYQDGIRIIIKRGELMEKAGQIANDPGSMMAVDAPIDFLEEHIAADTDLYFTNFNSPRQTVIGGTTDSIEQFKAVLDHEGYWNNVLPVSMVFHSPIMRSVMDEFRDFLSSIDMEKPQLPVISNVTNKAFPGETNQIIEILVTHLESPVYWQDNVLSLWNDYGVRTFLEIGPRNTLSNLIHDILPDALRIHCCFPEKETATFKHAIAQLYISWNLEADSILKLDITEQLSKQISGSSGSPKANKISQIVLEEIFSYALHGFGKYLKPVIIQAVRQKVDSTFDEHQLASYLPEGFDPTFEPESEQSVSADQDIEKLRLQEQVINIIMEATGYDRDEIKPEMDIRHDLAIQSSRIPVIIDAAEETFNISTSLEDFFTVKTINDLVDRISELMEEDENRSFQKTVAPETLLPIVEEGVTQTISDSERTINRMVFEKTEIIPQPVELQSIEASSTILLLILGDQIESSAIGSYFKKQYRADVISLLIQKENSGKNCINLFHLGETEQLIESLSSNNLLAGIVLITDDLAEHRLKLHEIDSFLFHYFLLFQHFLKSENRCFSIHLRQSQDILAFDSIITQSILGLYHTAIKEYKSLCFRSVITSERIEPEHLLNQALNCNNPIIELFLENDRIFTLKATQKPVPSTSKQQQKLSHGDVVVISGGGRGITAYLARRLAHFQCTCLLLGRSQLDPAVTSDMVRTQSGAWEDVVSTILEERYPTLSKQERIKKKKSLLDSIEIQRNCFLIEQLGAKVEYISCDITSKEMVDNVIRDIVKRYGKIDGIIHGAGLLRDGFIQLIDKSSFKEVMDVKLVGAAYLLEASIQNGLRFVIAFSSIAAAVGNTGQANYCMANRAMAAYIRSFCDRYPSILSKVFWLPPIEGAGMADTEEIKDIIRQNMGSNFFLNVDETAEIIMQELFYGPKQDHSVLPLRDVFQLDTALVDPIDPDSHWFSLDGFPMVDRIGFIDLSRKSILCHRTLSTDRDVWLNDHQPVKSIPHPIMSSVMAIESFFECSSFLFPYLEPTGMENIRFLQMVICPEGDRIPIEINGSLESFNNDRFTTQLELRQSENGPGQGSQHSRVCFTAQVITSASQTSLGSHQIDQITEEPPLTPSKIKEVYQKHSGLKGRYQVVDSIIYSSDKTLIGKMTYPEVDDFAGSQQSTFTYSHYLLEALMHTGFFITWMQDEVERGMVPVEIKTLLFSRVCQAGEELWLTGHLRHEDQTGVSIDAMATDRNGEIIMQIINLRMQWID